MRRRMVENRAPRRDEREAQRIRETFQDKPAAWDIHFDWTWPATLREIGVGMAVMYRSDKWKKPGNFEDYKHICESKTPWRLFASPDFTIEGVRLAGPSAKLLSEKMPDTIAELALLLGVQCQLFGKDGKLPAGDEGIFQVTIARGKLAAGRTRSGEAFLCMYVQDEGPKLFLFGEELDVEKDGIVG